MPSGEASFYIKPAHTSEEDWSRSSSAEETQATQRAEPGVELADLTQPQRQKRLCLLSGTGSYPLSWIALVLQGLPSTRGKAGDGEV